MMIFIANARAMPRSGGLDVEELDVQTLFEAALAEEDAEPDMIEMLEAGLDEE